MQYPGQLIHNPDNSFLMRISRLLGHNELIHFNRQESPAIT